MVDLKSPRKPKGILGAIEVLGNKLPHPVYIFLILALTVVVISNFTAGIKFLHPGTGKEEVLKSLATPDGFRWILKNLVSNFTRFPPLGMVLVMMIGLGLAEETGLLRALLRKAIVGAPKTLVTFIVIFSGVMGNIAGSATFVVIPPLGGLVFKALKRHPLAGIAAGFAGVAAGLSANLLITPTDVLCAGITEKAAQILNASFTVHPAVNWFFMFLATLLLSTLGVFVTEKIVEPRLGTYVSNDGDPLTEEDSALMEVTDLERKGLRNAGIATLLYFIAIASLVVPPGGILRDPKLGTIVPSPLLSSMIAILFFWFVLVALAYGITAKTIRNSDDVVKHMSESMKGFAGFIVLCFFAAQFVEFFAYTNLGLFLAVEGADYLQSSGFIGVPLIVAFIILVSLINFLIGSASAKWAILAPIFVPMFMKLGFSPFLTQAAFRVADSVTNCISPLEPFMPFIIICAQRYDKRAGLGTVISIMIPYAIVFLISWILLLIGFYVLNLPLGPGAPVGM
ncbi:AbgT family transporter [Fretibacterium sp. OH1220_COT-178]|uniref:AbgT family transporter n=1 Tax=Fretibacterium sp. OH1220_COT-178 TaxID=2491047 RepID=UPI000F5FC4F0|nr:AbgT family transporter [Fretibacterium sp. OH1220_COT-178]RRD65986.1 AbgT family transporter [Fretibacterium sp. OH1220_COT-178]